MHFFFSNEGEIRWVEVEQEPRNRGELEWLVGEGVWGFWNVLGF